MSYFQKLSLTLIRSENLMKMMKLKTWLLLFSFNKEVSVMLKVLNFDMNNGHPLKL